VFVPQAPNLFNCRCGHENAGQPQVWVAQLYNLLVPQKEDFSALGRCHTSQVDVKEAYSGPHAMTIYYAAAVAG
jgi:hypothetical protein